MHQSFSSLLIALTVGCSGVKLESDPIVEVEPSSEPATEPGTEPASEPASETDESASEPSNEPSGEPATEPSGEPSNEPDPLDVDNDGDGFSENEGDCLDGNSQIYPGADEVCDLLDNNCDGTVDNQPIDGQAYFVDADEDGFGTGFGVGTTCDAAPEGHSLNADDCDDSNSTVNPDGTEVCGDTLDNDCNGGVDDGEIWYIDSDGDGFGDTNNTVVTCTPSNTLTDIPDDCDDTDASIYPSAQEVLLDGVDQDCDGADRLYPYLGSEQVTYVEGATTPNQYECVLNWSVTGEASTTTCLDCEFAFDVDLTYDTTSISSANCSSVAQDEEFSYGYVSDYDGSGNPALLLFDSTNQEWSAWIDTSDGTSSVDFDGSNFTYTTGYIDYLYQGAYYSNYWTGSANIIPYDNDGDGLDSFADCNDTDSGLGSTMVDTPYDGIDQDCDGVDAVVDADGDGVDSLSDCNDNDANTYPGATEIPNDGIDQDCDGIDFVDADGDGFETSTDCNDNDATIYPGATEVLNDGIDQDCDGVDGTGNVDNDSDGFDNTVDCNDNDATIYPGATEVVGDGIDQDCDGSDLSAPTCPSGEIADCQGNCAPSNWLGDSYCDDEAYAHNGVAIDFNCAAFSFDDGDCPIDVDGDGFDDTVDCDDNDANAYPGATEIPNDGIDQDCDGIDFVDADGDGFETSTDCNDNDATIYPGATEVLNDGIDQDCNGSDAVAGLDADGDGVDSTLDCNDNDATIYPGATEVVGDGIDQDCDGTDTPFSQYTGVETYQLTETGQSSAGALCELNWDIASTSSLTTCSDCLFAFSLNFTFDSATSVVDANSATCTDSAGDASYDYGYVEDFDGNGNSAILIYNPNTSSWEEWFSNGTVIVNSGNPAVVDFTNGQFTYSVGYQDYVYQGYYFTNYVSGSATVQ